MISCQDHKVKISVRKLVEFLKRSGDIVSGSSVRADVRAMQEGSRLHRKIQKSQRSSYRSEVPLKMTWHEVCEETGEDFDLILEGRADGIDRIPAGDRDWQDLLPELLNQEDLLPKMSDQEDLLPKMSYQEDLLPKMSYQEDLLPKMSDQENLLPKMSYQEDILLIDEIKCVYHDVTRIEEPEDLHLYQAACYGYMEAKDKGLSRILLQITYCNIETEEVRRLHRLVAIEELSTWFEDLIDQLRSWAALAVASSSYLKNSSKDLAFPFDYRPGQRKMLALVYRAVHQGKHLFLQAPTGIGKTISALYPSIKELGEGNCDRVFYLTARGVTRLVAEETFRLLCDKGLRIHCVTITARDRICIGEETQCDPVSCSYARGHYDRINQALYRLLTEKNLITRDLLLDYARSFRVCPYELAFEAAAFCQCVICDVNYVFDPHVNARGLYTETGKKRSLLLIDEAHNLPDRARKMYSADLKREELLQIRRVFRKKNPYLIKKTRAVLRKLTSLENLSKADLAKEADQLYLPLLRLLDPLEEYLNDHPAFEDREVLVQIYFRLRHFAMILSAGREGYSVYTEGEKRSFILHFYCVDPSACIGEYLDHSCSSVFFSATLLPIGYYRQLLGGDRDIDAFSIPSPFDKSRRLIAVAKDVTSRYSMRGEVQYRRIISYLETTVRQKEGNYMIFFPSYEMLSACEAIARENAFLAGCRLLIQNPDMSEGEREAFLASFEQEGRTGSLVGFCVLGSLFSEGIDLTGDALIGVLIVGTGLPRICREREIIRSFFDNRQKKGYDVAYRYPGLNKVFQAAGRVIRTSLDEGVILLLDERFDRMENQILLPEDWDSFYKVTLDNCQTILAGFWEGRARRGGRD